MSCLGLSTQQLIILNTLRSCESLQVTLTHYKENLPWKGFFWLVCERLEVGYVQRDGVRDGIEIDL